MAQLGYRDLLAAGVVLPPPQEDYNPTIHRASATPHLMAVLPSEHPNPPEVFLVRDEGATQAYALTGRQPIRLTNRHPDWGSVLFAVVYRAIGLNVFRAPNPADAQFVAIKRLNTRIVHRYLAQGGEENPYKEMSRMEELGDNMHVLRHVEFLEDEDYMYIVTPKGSQDLREDIGWFRSENIMDPHRSHAIFCKILQILEYLEKHKINHHDLSPDNFLFLAPDIAPESLVVFDLAMSVRIPINPATGQRGLIEPQGTFGTPRWMDPFAFLNQLPYDGVAMDLWAAGVILYNLLTNQVLYDLPHPVDIFGFLYFIRARGLSAAPLNPPALDLLHAIADRAQFDGVFRGGLQGMIARQRAHVNLTPEAIELLENLLDEDPAERFTLADAMASPYVLAMEE